MFSASLKMVVLLLALLAGGFAMRGAASASPVAHPCHGAVPADHAGHAAPAAGRAAERVIVAADAHHAPHHHGPGRGCPTDGTCCDAFCHAVMTVSVPLAGALDVTFASYATSDDASGASLPVRGPERPPRIAAI